MSRNTGFPEVGGIIQASYVLPQLELQSISDSISFSIDISNLLGKIFQDVSLEFYVLLSNAEVVTEQSTYLPAALFGASIVRERRSRHLPASVLNIPEVCFGESYHAQKGHGRVGYQPISEEDFFAALAEAITTGSNVGGDYECTVGVGPIEANAPTKPKWFEDPRFGHLIYVGQLASEGGEGEGESVAASTNLKDQIAQASNPGEALEIVTGNIPYGLSRV